MITCKLENGNEANFRHVCVDALVLNPEQTEILLAKRSPKIIEGNKWGLIGGFLDRDETIFEGIKREIMEETGHKVDELTVLRFNSNPNRPFEDRQNIAIVFIAIAEKQALKPDWEATELKWFKFSEIPQEKEFAFDHYSNIELFLKHKDKNIELPIVE